MKNINRKKRNKKKGEKMMKVLQNQSFQKESL
jgi:hypothetical protein